MAPQTARPDEAYRTFQAAMTGRVGIGKLAIYGREYLVGVGPLDGVLLLYTLHHAAELRAWPTVARADRFLPGVAVARQILAAMTGPLDLTTFTDQYQVDLRRIIDAKIAGQEIVQPSPVDTPPALQLTNALTLSLAAMAAKKPARINKDGSKRKRTA